MAPAAEGPLRNAKQIGRIDLVEFAGFMTV
jgi:hypothetical protein